MYHIAPRHILELTLEVIFEHVLGIKTMTSIFNPGSRSMSLSLPRNQYRGESHDLIFKSSFWSCHRTEQDLITRSTILLFQTLLSLINSLLVQLQHLLLPSLIVTSSQVRVSTPLHLQSSCISGLGPNGLLHNRMILVTLPGSLPTQGGLCIQGNLCLREPSTRNLTVKVLSLQDSLLCSTRQRNR